MIIRSVSKIFQRSISALYITGDKAKENYAILTPYMNFKDTLVNNADKFIYLCKHRKLQINVPQLYDLWNLYSDMVDKRQCIENRRNEISNKLREILNNSNSNNDSNNENLIRKYKYEGTMLRNDLKMLKEKLYSVEEKFIGEFLELPNDLHERTMTQNVYEYGTNISTDNNMPKTDSHLKYIEEIDYFNRESYYLKNNASKYDLLLPFYVCDYFKMNNFIQCINSDFIRTIVAEAAGLKLSDVIFIKEDDVKLNYLHLVGNGSMLSYLGYIAKLSLFKSALPLKLISTGKQYTMINNDQHSINNGLYSVGQSTTVQLFIATMETESQKIFDITLEQIIAIYKLFGDHFKIVYAQPSELISSECLRADIQMYSKHLNCYVTVGNLSHYSDYISKRLLFNYRDEKKLKFPHIISGTIVNVTKLIAIQLENNQKIDFSFV